MPTGRASSINMVMKERDSTRWDIDVRDEERTANEEKKLGQERQVGTAWWTEGGYRSTGGSTFGRSGNGRQDESHGKEERDRGEWREWKRVEQEGGRR